MAPREGLEPSVDRLEIYCIIHYAIGAWQPRLDSNQRMQESKSCALPLGDWAINQDAAFSIDLPTDLSFQLEGVRIELTTYSLIINLLQASFLSYIYIISKNFKKINL